MDITGTEGRNEPFPSILEYIEALYSVPKLMTRLSYSKPDTVP
jgi:hypothetical protein